MVLSLSFKGKHYPRALILQAVCYYVSYQLSYRDIEEIFKERGLTIDHATLNRWVIEYAPQLEQAFRNKKQAISCSWRMDETYIKIKGLWYYLYRAVAHHGHTIDFYLSSNRDGAAAKRFFDKAIGQHGVPEKVVIDKSSANAYALFLVNIQLWLAGAIGQFIDTRMVKYLNNIGTKPPMAELAVCSTKF